MFTSRDSKFYVSNVIAPKGFDPNDPRKSQS
jgi:F-actin capping protein alpha subunit